MVWGFVLGAVLALGALVVTVILACVLIAAVGAGSVAGVKALVAFVVAPDRGGPSPTQAVLLAVLGSAAVVAAAWLAASADGVWTLGPLAVLAMAVAAVRHSRPRPETPEESRARCELAAQQRIEEFGCLGPQLIDQARDAVERVLATEAARDGWLGDPADLDFATDLAVITEMLRQARRIEQMMAELSAIPEPTPADIEMLDEARRKMRGLRGDVRQRVQVLDACADQAGHVDQALAEKREAARIAAQRDDARRQLAAELYGADMSMSVAPSDVVDAVSARVAAFRELMGVAEQHRQAGPAPPAR